MAAKRKKVAAKTKTKTSRKAKTKSVKTRKTKAKVRAKARTTTRTKAKAKTRAKTKVKAKTRGKVKVKKASPRKSTATKKIKTKVTVVGKKTTKKSSSSGKAKADTKAKPSVVATSKARTESGKKAAPRKTAASKEARTKTAKTAKEQAGFKPYIRRTNKEYMNEQQRNHFKDLLSIWKIQLMEEVDRTVSHMKDEAANYPDPSDRASQEEEFSLELRTRDRERKLIRKIDNTIELIDQHDYGYCESCGIEIGFHRLEARPTATQCIDCKTLDEMKEKQLHG